MVPARRATTQDGFAGSGVADTGYQAGGEVGRLHAELAGRLGNVPATGLAASVGDRHEAVIRRVSVASGYLALGGGYAVALWAMFGS